MKLCIWLGGGGNVLYCMLYFKNYLENKLIKCKLYFIIFNGLPCKTCDIFFPNLRNIYKIELIEHLRYTLRYNSCN